MLELRSPDGRTRTVVLPEHGGRLHQLFVTVDGQEEPLLWSPENVHEYADQPTRGGSFPMAPWPNRIREGRFTWEGQEYCVPTEGKPHATHGRVLQRAQEVSTSGERSAELRCEFDEGWPWDGWAEQRFEVGDGELRMELSVHSSGERFPVGAGWHPWFKRDAAGSETMGVRVDADERYVLVENIPSGEVVRVAGDFDLRAEPELGDRRLDDCYRGLWRPVELEWERVRLRMEVDCQWPHVQVFTPDDAVAVEPQTCVADAFNLSDRGVAGVGLQVAAPGRPVRIASTWRWEERRP